jgi:hypothetical protein
MTIRQGPVVGQKPNLKNTRLGQKFHFCAEHVNLYDRRQKFEKNCTIAATKKLEEKVSEKR